MTHVPACLSSARHSTAALSGGKSPACWWRDSVRKTEGLTAVRRAGVWVEEIRAIHPRLCEGPLLGTTLSVLTGRASHAQETQPKTARPGKARFARWENPLELNRNKTTANASTSSPFQPKVEETPASRSAETLSRLQAQANGSLLNRLAGGKLTFQSTAQSSPVKGKHDVVFGGTAQEQTRSFSATGKSNAAIFPPACRESAAQQDWLNRLGQRAGKAMRQPDTTGSAKPAQDDAQVSGQSPSLQEQWAMPLDGTCASLDLLNRLVQEDLPGGEGNRALPRSSRGQPPSLEKPHPPRPIEKSDEFSQRSDGWDGWHGEPASGGNDFESKVKLPDTAQASSALFAPEPGVDGQIGHGEGETKSSVPIIPPNVTPSLPDLLPPQRVGAQPLPVAAATARRGAREEAAMNMDDLDTLAGKIKQILDEQARRHGIDV
ncbi:MAG: hypothetical protein ACHBNF_21420 [Chromatiales bacterium]